MRRVITYGYFDLLHYGHIHLLRKAKEQGDYLIVALADDEFVERAVNIECYFNYEERKQLLEAIRYVDLVIPEKTLNQKLQDLQLYQIDVLVMGGDNEGKYDFMKEYCDVVYIPRTTLISTAKIKRDLKRK
jgi:glycerol-3-phosphate cytidylyltransferase